MIRSQHIAVVIAIATTSCFVEVVEKDPDDEMGESGETGSTSDSGDPQPTCGDMKYEEGEQCDGNDLDGHSCEELGLGGGTLACSPECTFDISGCMTNVCGDGIAGMTEECDGDDFSGRDCWSFGFAKGELLCTPECAVDSSGCSD